MLFITTTARDSEARRGDGEYVHLDEEAGWRESCGTHGHSWLITGPKSLHGKGEKCIARNI